MQPCISALAIFLISFFPAETVPGKGQLITLEQLQTITQQPGNDTLYVVNFWATWCKPCIEEMPYFLESSKKFSGSRIKIIFVSLDFASELERVRKFAEKRIPGQEYYLLNAGNPNDWIDKVDPSWSGAIPATVLYSSGKKNFFREGDLQQLELDSIINMNLQ
jgi:thiol-disulfide isomerase/thioredoxin